MAVLITIYSMIITIGIYLFSLKLSQKYRSLLTMPIFFCTVTIITILLISNISYEQYLPAKEIMSYLLGPATVALAVPLYKERETIYRNFRSVLAGIIIGSTATIVSAVYLAKWAGLSDVMLRSLSIKSITIPIASEVSYVINADPSLVTLFVITAGMFGAMFGSLLLNIAKVSDPVARGLSFGTISHGIGTSEALKEGVTEGATSSVAIGLTGIITSLIIPWVLPLML